MIQMITANKACAKTEFAMSVNEFKLDPLKLLNSKK